jgi:phosphate-selective porin OprO/OprP
MKSRIVISIAAIAVLASGASRPLVAQTIKPVPTPSTYNGGYLVFQSADGAFQYWLDGRMQVDAAAYRGNTNELGSGTDVRRARLGWKATLFKNWHGETDVDFAENSVEMKDMWIGYVGFEGFLIRAGQYKEPFSLETLTSSKYINFMERSYIDNLSPDRHIGAGVSTSGKWFYASGGVFGQAVGTVDATGQAEGHAYTGRLVIAPIHSDGRLIHFGGALSRRTPDAAAGVDTSTVRFRARPETWISKSRFISTGKIRGVDYTNYVNAEFASTYGPALLQAEYSTVAIHKLGGLPGTSFDGGYVAATYFITGEHRPYVMEEGEFDRVIPKSQKGALEVAARWSTLDLNDPTPGVDIRGGRGTNATLGLNWHINANFKWMMNVTRVHNDNNAKPDIGTAPFVIGDKFTIIQSRFALAF